MPWHAILLEVVAVLWLSWGVALRHAVGALFAGLAAFWLARALGVPLWRDYWPGDATDIGMMVFVAIVLLVPRP